MKRTLAAVLATVMMVALSPFLLNVTDLILLQK